MDKISLKETNVIHRSDNLMMNIYRGRREFYLHWHDEYEFLYAEDDCTVIADGYTYTLNKGDVLLIEGGVLHSKNNTHGGKCTAVVVHPHLLGNDCMSYFGNGISYPRIFRRGEGIGDMVIDNIIGMGKCFEEKSFGYELRIKSLLSDTFAALIENNCFTVTEKFSRSNDTFKKLIEFIQDNYRSSITLETLCKISNYSRCYIIRLFKKHTNQTPIGYINGYRITKSAELLSGTDMSVIDVSLECGFENTGYFISLFKKRYGTTPLKWKNGKRSI